MSGRVPDRVVLAPVNFQTWQYLTFLHWSYEPSVVQALVPEELTVQQWNSRTWVGITPFQMARVRGPFRVPIPGWDAFPELNVRAYVRTDDGRDGIWFLGMVVPKISFVAAARSVGLPYERSAATVSVGAASWAYRFGTPNPFKLLPEDDWFGATVTVGEPLAASDRTELVDSVTGRWTAFHRRARQLWGTPVSHEPWPLRAATASGHFTEPLRWVGLPEPDNKPLVHAASIVHTRLGVPRRV
ncbi:YqjF family protein [Enteractinococcus fodinae]|uniref:Uncharacterized protein YqjF (DUF2071 family) n=1 Tax=Enteractinococcus fodinae TaxID=684663 RepID=A0ABU2AYD2_9MICC|nr:DUF2071 domain-containing protein [Enteractinococcus fodinae]MDR7345784.1 uncharacterized protein YqjF (DUF2071 family) [Enteractinococcus fodinae]